MSFAFRAPDKPNVGNTPQKFYGGDNEDPSNAGKELKSIPQIISAGVTQEQKRALGAYPEVKASWNYGTGAPSSLRGFKKQISGSPAQAAVSFLEEVKAIYRMKDAFQETRLRTIQEDKLGFRHVRLDQYYQGIPVVGSQLIVHINRDNAIYQVNGKYTPDIAISITPSLDANQARQVGLALFAGKANLRVSREPELVVYPVENSCLLAYYLVVSYQDGQDGAGRWVCYLDANTGEVIYRYNDIEYVAAPSSAGTHVDIEGFRLAGEDGTDTFVQGWHETASNIYYLYNKNLWWYIFNAATTGGYSDLDTYAYRFGTGDWGTSDRTEISAAKNLSLVQDYFKTVYSRDSFNDASAYAIANVHYGINYVNAFWDPDFNQFYIGDGDGGEANSLAVLDVMAHEYGHAWTQYTSELIYDYTESGALNESFSDINGANVEFYSQPDGRSNYPLAVAGTADWLMGEDCWLSSTALRDMRNPSNTTTVGAGNEQPSRYHGAYWDDVYEEMHTNDGVQNFFYYLLSEGGSGTNDGIPYDFTGLGIDNAQMVAYQANTNYLGPSDSYYTARDGWISAASDLGDESWVDTVKAAWAACGLVDVPGSPGADFEGTTLPAGWTTGGDADWYLTTSDKVQGSKSIRSGVIGNNQLTWLQWEGTLSSACVFSFFTSVSSERWYDFLNF
jgi:thermolysin